MVTDILEKCSASIFRAKQPKKSIGMLEPKDRNNPPLNIGNYLIYQLTWHTRDNFFSHTSFQCKSHSSN